MFLYMPLEVLAGQAWYGKQQEVWTVAVLTVELLLWIGGFMDHCRWFERGERWRSAVGVADELEHEQNAKP